MGGVKKTNPERLSAGKSKELQEDKTRGKEESLWKCMRCEKLTGQLNMPKYDQRLSQCHCCVLLFSTLPLFPLSSLQRSSSQTSPNPSCSPLWPATTAHATGLSLLAFCLCTNCFFASPGPADGISAFCALLLKKAHEHREPTGSGGWLMLL